MKKLNKKLCKKQVYFLGDGRFFKPTLPPHQALYERPSFLPHSKMMRDYNNVQWLKQQKNSLFSYCGQEGIPDRAVICYVSFTNGGDAA
ncbi:MAG: hypothetical protein ACE5K8_08700 [Candidatus Zixiibacteriota bacterium]